MTHQAQNPAQDNQGNNFTAGNYQEQQQPVPQQQMQQFPQGQQMQQQPAPQQYNTPVPNQTNDALALLGSIGLELDTDVTVIEHPAITFSKSGKAGTVPLTAVSGMRLSEVLWDGDRKSKFYLRMNLNSHPVKQNIYVTGLAGLCTKDVHSGQYTLPEITEFKLRKVEKTEVVSGVKEDRSFFEAYDFQAKLPQGMINQVAKSNVDTSLF